MNNFSLYRIWDPKDDRRGIAWASSCPFHTVPSCIIVLFSTVSDTSALLCVHTCPLLVAIALPVVWFGAAVGWASGYIVSGALVRVEL